MGDPVKVMAIDPGRRHIGVTVCNGSTPVFAADLETVDQRPQLLGLLLEYRPETVLWEWVKSYGNQTGQDVMRTAFVCGIPWTWCEMNRIPYVEMTRPDVLGELFGYHKGISKAAAKRRAQEFFPQTGGGKTPAVGTKKQPGPLRLFSGKHHAWDALELWLAWGIKLKRERKAKIIDDSPTKINPFGV